MLSRTRVLHHAHSLTQPKSTPGLSTYGQHEADDGVGEGAHQGADEVEVRHFHAGRTDDGHHDDADDVFQTLLRSHIRVLSR